MAKRRLPTPADPDAAARGGSARGGRDLDIPVPNPPPIPSDLPAPSLITPRGALRRSLVIWGWGQLAAGDRRGWLGPPVQAGAITVLVVAGPALAAGTGATLAFVLACLLFAAWTAVAAGAYRRAARRRAALDLPAGNGGAADLLWLGPFVVVLATGFWIAGGRAAEPATVLDDYVADWRTGDADSALRLFDRPPASAAEIAETWQRQLAGLRNDLVRIAAAAGPGSGIDPDRPLDSVRWVEVGVSPAGGRLIAIEVARRETVRGQLLGFLPTTSQRLVTLERLGLVELRLVDRPGPIAFGPRIEAWRLVRIDVGGVVVGG